MREVYANSICNISAAASHDPHGGFFRLRDERRILPVVHATWADHGEKYLMVDWSKADFAEKHLFNAHIMSRGWVLQERLLAPRVLHFTEHQIFWECDEPKGACEIFPAGMFFGRVHRLINFPVIGHRRPLSNSQLTQWFRIVERYTLCKLSHSKDKLIAFSGIARFVLEITGDEYCAGLWRSRILDCLLWRKAENKPIKNPSSANPPRPRREPSWSWASLDCPVTCLFIPSTARRFVATVIDIGTELVTDDLTGPVIRGSLTIEGPVCQVAYNSIGMESQDPEADAHGFYADFVLDSLYSLVAGSDYQLVCLAIVANLSSESLEGLVLSPSHSSSHEYTRCGWFECSGGNAWSNFGIATGKDGGPPLIDETFVRRIQMK